MISEGGTTIEATSDPVESAVDEWIREDDRPDDGGQLVVYGRYIRRKWIYIIACIVATFLAAGLSMAVGAYDIGFWETYETIWNHLTDHIVDINDNYVMWELRMPRVITAILAGLGLAGAGVVMQSILRNPLADPYTTGISSGASFGATLAIGMGLTLGSAGYAVVINAFIFSLIPMAVILAVAKLKNASPTTMVMAGIAVMYIFNACTTLIKLWVDPDKLSAIFEWSVGSLEGTSWDNVKIMFFFVLIGMVGLQLLARKLNVISTGDESSRSIGVNAEQLRIIALLIVSLLTAGIVSFTGLIGFVGLVCPHISRLVIGSDNRYLIPASAAFGAALLLIADAIGRYVISPNTIQVGVITAFIGAPLFLYLIIKQNKGAYRWKLLSSKWTMSHSVTRPGASF